MHRDDVAASYTQRHSETPPRRMDAAEWAVAAIIALIAVQVVAYIAGPWIDWWTR